MIRSNQCVKSVSYPFVLVGVGVGSGIVGTGEGVRVPPAVGVMLGVPVGVALLVPVGDGLTEPVGVGEMRIAVKNTAPLGMVQVRVPVGVLLTNVIRIRTMWFMALALMLT